MLTEIHLHGLLGERFGARYSLDVAHPAEAVRALSYLQPGFCQAIAAGRWHVVRGPLGAGGISLGEGELQLGLGRAGQLHILPAIEGGKKSGLLKVVLGVAIIGAAVAFAPAGAGLGATAFEIGSFGVSYGSIASTGLSMVLSGISQVLAPTPQVANYEQRERPDERPSFMFNEAVNVSAQGTCVPVCYGRFRCGTVVVSSGLSSERV